MLRNRKEGRLLVFEDTDKGGRRRAAIVAIGAALAMWTWIGQDSEQRPLIPERVPRWGAAHSFGDEFTFTRNEIEQVAAAYGLIDKTYWEYDMLYKRMSSPTPGTTLHDHIDAESPEDVD